SHEEPFYAGPAGGEQLVVVQADLGSLGSVSRGDRPAQGDPAPLGHVEEGGVQEGAADVVEDHVVAVPGQLAEAATHVVVVVRDAVVEAGDITYPCPLL